MATVTLTLAAPAPLEVRSLHAHEAISAPFGVALVCASTDAHLDPEAFVGKDARVFVDREALGARGWGGVCTEFSALAGDEAGVSLYAVHVAPRAALLAHRRDHRAFSGKSAPDIAREIFGLVGQEVELRLGEAHAPLAFRAQRGESHLAFAERVLEDAGVSYAFEEQTEGGAPTTRVVLLDAPERAEPKPGARLSVVAAPDPASAEPFATDVRAHVTLRPGALEQGSHDFLRPRFHPRSVAKRAGRGEGQLTIARFGAGASGSERERASAAETALAAARFDRSVVVLTTNVCSFGPGDAIDLAAGAARGDRRLVVTRSKLTWREHAPLEVELTAAPAGEPIRPARKAERPKTPGVEVAFVDGPEPGSVHTDEHGRVQLHFAWDHTGEGGGPWARLDAPFAGAGFGAIALPRVGDEVLVSYLHGDPDEPVVIGRLHNASSPAVHALPHGATKSGLVTSSTGDEGGGHELTFDDRKGAEMVRLRSERDLAKTVKAGERATVGEDATAIVGGSLTTTVGESVTVDVAGLHEVRMAEVKDARAGSAAGPDLAATSTRREIVGQRITLTTGGATIVLDGPDIVVSADAGLRIAAGGTVSIQGEPYVHLNPPGPPPRVATEPGAPALDHVVWFKLHSEGLPLAGVRVHVSEDAKTDSAQVVRAGETDGNGQVRIAVPEAGDHTVTVARGSALAPEGVVVAKVAAQPAANASPSEHEMPVTIEVVAPKHGETFHLHHAPSMPKIPVEARVLVGGKPVQEGRVRWTFELEGKYRVRSSSGSSFREQSYALRAGHATTLPGEARHVELAPAEIVGGDLAVTAHFDGGEALGGVRGKKTIHGLRVLGQNPPREDVERYIEEHAGDDAWVFLRLFCFESLHQLAQFARKSGGGNTPGEPLYGPPSGVGIVQRDPVADEWRFPKARRTEPNHFFPRMFWDWRRNLDEGMSSFRGDYIERGRADLDRLRAEHRHLPAFSRGVLLRAAIRRYNGGVEYGASSDGLRYVVAPTFTNNPGYVDEVLGDPHADAAKYPVPHDARAKVWPG